jgi:hypothetical protein
MGMAKKVEAWEVKTNDGLVRLDLNNPVFQGNLFALEKQERNAVLDTFNKLHKLTWNQVCRDQGLKWEKVYSVKQQEGIEAVYSLRITRSRRTETYCQQDFLRFITISQDNDSTYGKK